MPLENSFGRRIGFLQINAPVSQFLKRNGGTCDGTTDIGARPHDAKIAVQVFDFGLSRTRGPTISAIEQGNLRCQ